MGDRTVSAIESSLHKTYTWLDELSTLGHFENNQQSYSVLRAVLHALRDRLPIDEAVHLAAELPMFIRGLYFEGWKPAAVPERERTVQEFLACVQKKLRNLGIADIDRGVRAVFEFLTNKISAGEISDVRSSLPRPIQELWVQPRAV